MNSSSTAIELTIGMAQRLFFDTAGAIKSKYESKAAIIREADDLRTREKLDAYDAASSQYFLDIFICLCIAGTACFLLGEKPLIFSIKG